MKSREELVVAIGNHILDCYDSWTKDPRGIKVVIPNKIPRERFTKEFKVIYPNFSDWIITTEVTGLNMQVKEAPGKFRIIGPDEYFKMIEDLS